MNMNPKMDVPPVNPKKEYIGTIEEKDILKRKYLTILNNLAREYQKRAFHQLTEQEEKNITTIENSVKSMIGKSDIPFIYKLSFDNFIKNKNLPHSIEMSHPLTLRDKKGEEYLVLITDDQIKICDKESETETKKLFEQMSGFYRTYEGGIQAIKERFNQFLDPESFGINKNDLEEYKLFLSDNFQTLLSKLFNKSLKDESADFKKFPDLIAQGEQGFLFFKFILKTNEAEFLKVKDFCNKFGFLGLKTFLSIEQGGSEMGDKILTLGEKLPQESSNKLFDTYSKMVDATEEVGTLLNENLKEKATPELVSGAKESLLVAGKDLLEKYASKSKTCEAVDCENLGKELEERLELAKSSVFAFSYACKTLVEHGEFSFEDFKKAKLAYDKSPLPDEMKEKILSMHRENTKQYPEKLRDKWRGTLRDGLEKENPKQMIVSVSYADEVVSAMRVIAQDDGSWYGASFNVNPTVQGSRIGTELLKKVLEDLAKDKPFKAHVYSGNPMLNTYTEKFGFKITKEIPNYEDTGELVYEITLAPKKG